MSNKLNIPLTVDKKCSLKCNYFYSYENSPQLTVEREGTPSSYLTIKGPGQSGFTGNVMYNGVIYNTNTIFLYNGGIHKFSNNDPEIEIVIEHTSTVSTSSKLYVCIPIFKTTGSSTSDVSYNLIDRLISSYYDDSTDSSVTVSDFNINTIIPQSTYFVHTGIYRTYDDDAKDVYIVFP